jgi:hypothetical protein
MCEGMVDFWNRNGGVLCNKLKRIRFRETHRVSKFDAEVEMECGAARMR